MKNRSAQGLTLVNKQGKDGRAEQEQDCTIRKVNEEYQAEQTWKDEPITSNDETRPVKGEKTKDQTDRAELTYTTADLVDQAEQWRSYQDGSTSENYLNDTQCPTKTGPVARYVDCPVKNQH